MKFKHQFRVSAPLSEVVSFHRRATGLKALTPPVAFMRLHDVPDPIQQGDRLRFSLWLGLIHVRWESLFPVVTETGFTDTQGEGPFAEWQHRHTFIPVEENQTEIVDQIEAKLRPHLWHGFVGLLMWLTLPYLFWYRQIVTRRILERTTD